ncbi:TerC/Alx family metal homeostasis membrane protein [Brachybacterium sp. ACRRE]|uniref:TerC/Alx family metal homeostasis membrane protein n=1 Tax=Brachybacterium sp. ACRRE TaxID=2918184 RepID=UPI001EF29B5F|nr:TerC/Alx family metal homeostasis membrane protein [Brachybacterium sp. ACRRE]MCG7309542.1 TerC/Alx family metal homeostasis membrane protein [Brachybacterium sp. ACRRE]
MGELSMTFEITSLVVLIAIIVGDLILVSRRPHVPSMKECLAWVGFYVALALVFALILYFVGDTHHVSVEFLTGWLTEYSLSVDNLFVFILIMGKFAVPKKYQQEVLMVGIIIALIARAIFILVGSVAISHLSWIFYIFGIFLLYTAIKQVKGDDDEDDGEDSAVQKFVGRFIHVHDEYDGNKIRTVLDGKKVFTPMLMVFVVIGLTDVMFAIDSIPAIFGITQNPFIVFTANLFALMGLRQLYFLLGGLVDRLAYLHYGIAAILAFIGVKLLIHAIHEAPLEFIPGFEALEKLPEIGTAASLIVIIGAMAIATVASLLWGPKSEPEEVASDSGDDQQQG